MKDTHTYGLFLGRIGRISVVYQYVSFPIRVYNNLLTFFFHPTECLSQYLEIISMKQVILFHGFQGYPTPIEDNQISRMQLLKNAFSDYKNVVLGFSDHVDPTHPSSITLPSYAVGQGAVVLEKHLTLGCCMELEDHEAAMNPDQFKK